MLKFTKMHGLGNDFVVLDARQGKISLDANQVQRLADRRFGIGCDQLITLEPSSRADVFMRIHNADGGEVEACGNAARCIARRVMRERGATVASIETAAGVLQAEAVGEDRVSVDMGIPALEWQQIPLARAMDTLHMDFTHGSLVDPVAVNIGNPHVIFFVPDAAAIDLAQVGPEIEHAPLFPARVNVSLVEMTGINKARLRVWERGAGITKACGTAACASAVALVRRKMAHGVIELILDGGSLWLEWRADGHVIMTGATAETFHGEINPSLLGH